MELRDYQAAAISATWEGMRTYAGQNPCIVLPTGAGKSPVIATLCRDAVQNWMGRVMVVTHVKELIEQLKSTIIEWYPGLDVGVYSAGLNARCVDNQVVIAGIQSAYKRAGEFGRRHLTIIDEAHLIPEHEDGMYRQFLAEMSALNPNHRVVGLTATPYRTGAGEICAPENILNYESYRAEICGLIAGGYLSRLQNDKAAFTANMSQCAKARGDFAAGEMENIFNNLNDNDRAVRQIADCLETRTAGLVFCSGVKHGATICQMLNDCGVSSSFVYGEMDSKERAKSLDNFQKGRVKCLVNVNVLTTGFDATHVDLVAVLRATTSPGLFYQMCGRGFRLHPGKEDCLVLDFGGNIARHGSLDDPQYGQEALAAWKQAKEEKAEKAAAKLKMCPACGLEVSIQAKECPCGLVFPDSMMPADPESDHSILRGDLPEPEWMDVIRTTYSLHMKNDWSEGDLRTMRVEYYWSEGMRDWPIREWVCVEHTGFAGDKAADWWSRRCDSPVPTTVEAALWFAANGHLADTLRIKVGPDPKNSKFKRIVDYKLGDVPSSDCVPPPAEARGFDPGQGVGSFLDTLDSDIPF